MSRSSRTRSLSGVLALAATLLPTGCARPAPSLASSPAIGTWGEGALTYTLNPDGTGQEIAGRETTPLTWTEQDGTVILEVHHTTSPAAEETGRLAANNTLLTISRTSSKTWLFGRATFPVHWSLHRR